MPLQATSGAASYDAFGGGPPFEPVYIESVFSTWLYTGNSYVQTIDNGIALADGINIAPGTALAGGYFAGFISTSGNGVATHALIVAPKATGESSSLQWKTSQGTTGGASSNIDGPANSAALNNSSHPAAQFCEGLSIGGYSDWYLPAKNEIEVCYFNLKPTTLANILDGSGQNSNSVPSRNMGGYVAGTPARTSATAFISGGAEAFANTWYWSSTEYSSAGAWAEDFSDGEQGGNTKTNSYYVRAVRRIAVSDAALDPFRQTGKGGLVWIKARTNAASGDNNHELYDTARGVRKVLNSNQQSAENTLASNGLTAFGAAGFTVIDDSFGSYGVNGPNGRTFASWTFRKQPKFFDVVTWTGNNADGRFISHSLGSTPGMVIIKNLTSTYDWVVWHRSLANPSKYLVLNSTAATATDIYGPFGSYDGGFTTNAACFTSTGFYVAADARSNLNANNYVAYVFAHDAGGFGLTGTDNVISCGSFTTDSGGAASVTLGYEPQFIITKKVDGTAQNWQMVDSMRGMFAPSAYSGLLVPNATDAEEYNVNRNPNATGFSGFWTPSSTFIYIAIRRGPMKTPTSGTSVFTTNTYTGTGAARTITTGFVTDLVFGHGRTNDISGTAVADRLRGDTKYLETTSTAAETTSDGTSQDITGFDLQTGYTLGVPNNSWMNNNGSPGVNWAWRRAPGFFDVVCYTGNGSTQAVTHNLGVAPEIIIVKNRTSARDWFVYLAPLGVSYRAFLNSTVAATNTGPEAAWGNNFTTVAPTSTQFTVGYYVGLNASGENLVAYLFASCPGVSKVGSYTGTGTTQQINCGFTGGARFVLIKRTDSTGDWYCWDSSRGIVSGNDPFLLLNSTSSEVPNTDYVDTYSAGFEISSTAPAAINANGGTYIFLAIA